MEKLYTKIVAGVLDVSLVFFVLLLLLAFLMLRIFAVEKLYTKIVTVVLDVSRVHLFVVVWLFLLPNHICSGETPHSGQGCRKR